MALQYGRRHIFYKTLSFMRIVKVKADSKHVALIEKMILGNKTLYIILFLLIFMMPT